MILKNAYSVLDADGVTIHENVPCRFMRVEGLPKRAAFALARRLKADRTEGSVKRWVLAEVQSTAIVGTGATPEAAICAAVERFKGAACKGDYKAFRRLCRGYRSAWFKARPEDELPFMGGAEQLDFLKNPMALRKLPLWIPDLNYGVPF
jgi:hypothetical protein